MYGGSIYPSDSDYSTDGSYIYYERPDTPMPETPRQYDVQTRGMWGIPPSVNGNDDYLSSVLNKDSYLWVYRPLGLVLIFLDDLRALDTTLRHSM